MGPGPGRAPSPGKEPPIRFDGPEGRGGRRHRQACSKLKFSGRPVERVMWLTAYSGSRRRSEAFARWPFATSRSSGRSFPALMQLSQRSTPCHSTPPDRPPNSSTPAPRPRRCRRTRGHQKGPAGWPMRVRCAPSRRAQIDATSTFSSVAAVPARARPDLDAACLGAVEDTALHTWRTPA